MDIRRIIAERMRSIQYPRRSNNRVRPQPLNPNVLAARANLPPRTVYRYLAGETEISAEKLGRILDALELEIVPKEKGNG